MEHTAPTPEQIESARKWLLATGMWPEQLSSRVNVGGTANAPTLLELFASYAASRAPAVSEELVVWGDPKVKTPPSEVPAGHILLGYSNRKDADEDYALRQLAFCPDPPEHIWSDWYGSVPPPDRWTIIPIPDKDSARWYMPNRDIKGETYSTILVNAMRLPIHEQNRMIKDLCDRGATASADLSGVSVDDGWISVKDRLPELPIVANDGSRFSGTVMVYRSKAPKHTCIGESQYGDYGKGDAGWLGESGQGVTHWQPLPPPPVSASPQ